MITESVDAILRNAMFTIPGRVTAFDPKTQLAQVEAGIKYAVNGEPTTLPPIEDVPVCFAGDGTWYLWHAITPGETEGLIHFSQRAIDTWIDQGGPVEPHERRILSANDAFFAPGYRSRPGAIPNFRNKGAGISDYSGSTYIHLTSSGTEVENDVEIAGDETVTGSLSVDKDQQGAGGEITAATSVTAPKISGTTSITSPAIEGTTSITSPAVSGTTSVDTPQYKVDGTPGVTGSFTTSDGKTVTVTSGIITAIA